MKPPYSPRRVALAVALFALALRVAYVLVGGRHQGILPGHDAVSYDAFARLMLSGWQWVSAPLAVREPVYPAFMAFVYALPTPEFGTLQAVQALLGAATAALIYLGLRERAGEAVAVVCALVVAVNPDFIIYAPQPLRENVVIPLLTAFLVGFLSAMARGGRWRLFLSMLWFVLLCHADVRFLPLVATLPVMVYLCLRDAKVTLRQSAWLFLFFAVLMVPYQVRSSLALGEPVIITERFLGKWLDRAAAVTTGSDLAGARGGRDAWLGEWESRKRGHLDALSEAERAYFLAGGRPHTARLAVHWDLLVEYWRFARLRPMYRPYPDGRFEDVWSLQHNASGIAVVLPFFVLLPYLARKWTPPERWVALPLLFFLLAHTLMHVLVHARSRYRIPMELITSIIVGMALVHLWNAWRGGRAADARSAPVGN
ncbi:MAG: glycosyltransferase family 39 protein [Candidatus Krumholzibacteria bacterium]|nr:glycosyltransferase family 39 protein [Candidatus Krumholzibacteria bacterium]